MHGIFHGGCEPDDCTQLNSLITEVAHIRRHFTLVLDNYHEIHDEHVHHSQLQAYQVVSDEELFTVQSVQLTVSLEKIISQPGLRVICESCGEELTNEREVFYNGKTLCRACAGDSYYLPADQPITRL